MGLRNKRAEKVCRKSEFAEYGLKAALNAAMFSVFDQNANGLAYKEDVMRIFAKVDSVSAEQAHAIATAIFEEADVTNNSAETSGEQRAVAGDLDFSEFVQCVEDD